MKKVKQVIVLRKFDKIRTGKYIAQACHSCMKIFFEKFSKFYEEDFTDNSRKLVGWKIDNVPYFEDYLNGAFTKIVLSVDTEEELLNLYKKVQDAGIHCSLIKDAGLTEFGGVPTYTAVGIGPWDSKEIDEITGHLKLL